jgi:DNA-binding NarL/FixJ family response regulator
MRLILAITSPETRFAVDLVLSQEPSTHVVATASDIDGLLALLATVNSDLVIAEWSLPGQPMRTLLVHKATYTPPFIILSHDDTVRQAALNAGAAAFVVTGSRPETLLIAYRAVREQITAHQRSKVYHEQE